MSNRTEMILQAIGLFNAAIPGIVGIVATLKSGATIDITQLQRDTEDRTAKVIGEGTDFLGGPPPAPEDPE